MDVQELDARPDVQEWKGFRFKTGETRIRTDKFGILYGESNSKICFKNMKKVGGVEMIKAEHDPTLWAIKVYAKMPKVKGRGRSVRIREIFTANEEMAKEFTEHVESAIDSVPAEDKKQRIVEALGAHYKMSDGVTLHDGTPVTLRFHKEAIEMLYKKNKKDVTEEMLFDNIVAEHNSRRSKLTGNAIKVLPFSPKGEWSVQVLMQKTDDNHVGGWNLVCPNEDAAEALRDTIMPYFNRAVERGIEQELAKHYGVAKDLNEAGHGKVVIPTKI